MKKLTLLVVAFGMLTATSFSQNSFWMTGSESSGFKDQAFATDIDLSGNTYVAGNYADSLHVNGMAYANYVNDLSNDGFVAKYNPDGTLAWIKTVNGLGNQLLKALKVDKTTGDCYVSGSFTNDFYVDGIKQNTQTFSGFSTNFSRSLIIRFDTNGNLVWSNNTYSNAGYAVEGGQSIALSPDGSGVYMANGFIGDILFESGEAFLPSGFGGQGIILSRLNTSNGTISAFRNDIERYLVDGFILDTDNDGNVIFAGSHRRNCMWEVDNVAFPICDTNPNYAHPEAFIWKMDANFVSLWGKEINGVGDEVITAVGTDAQNNIYAYGTFSSLTSFDNTDILPDAGKLNAFVVKYNPSGNYQFIKQFSAEYLYITEFPTDYESPFAVDAKGNIFLGGGFAGTLTYGNDTLVSNSAPFLFYTNGFLIKLNKNGNLRWAETFEGNVGPHDETYVRGLGLVGSYISVCGEFGWYNAYQGDTIFSDGNAFFVNAIQDCDVTINVSASALLVSPAFPVTLTTPMRPGYSYQWQRNNIDIAGAVSNTYIATTPGNYSCVITTGICTINSKRVRLFLHPREAGEMDNSVTIYPNPATEQFNIQLSESQFNKTFNLTITDLTGRLIYNNNINSGESGLININLQNSISSGTYMLQLTGDNFNASQAIIIE